MLSKTAAILLGIIQQRPLNAYEITKVLTRLQVKRWYRIPDSTVYATLRSAEKKQYIQGRLEKDGNMPDKTIYRLTLQGKAALVETLEHFLVTVEYDTVPFFIAVFFIPLLERGRALALLEKRRAALENIRADISAQIEAMLAGRLSPLAVCNVRGSAGIIDAQCHGTELLMEFVQNSEDWEQVRRQNTIR